LGQALQGIKAIVFCLRRSEDHLQVRQIQAKVAESLNAINFRCV
jgi:hypothetical protein